VSHVVWLLGRYDITELQHPAAASQCLLADCFRLRSKHGQSTDWLPVISRPVSPPPRRQYLVYWVAPQNVTVFVEPLNPLSNINRFSKFSHCQKQEKICNNIITEDPTTPQGCRYTTLW